MKVLVTGASGFIGSRVVNELKCAGLDVITVGGPSRSSVVDYFVDVSDKDSVESLSSLGQIDVVIHAAALAHQFAEVSDSEFYRVNVDGVANVAEIAARLGAKHFILFSSTLVYGRRSDISKVIDENCDCRPNGAYAQSKFDGELIARSVCEKNSIDLTIFRPTPVIGEGSKGNFGRLIKEIDRKRFVMIGKGKNRKSLIYVGDIAKITTSVTQQGGDQTQIFNLSGGDVSMIDVVSTIYSELGRKMLPITIPPFLLKGVSTLSFIKRFKKISTTLDTWLADDVYSNNKLRLVYGLEPEISIRAAIKLETDFYLANK